MGAAQQVEVVVRLVLQPAYRSGQVANPLARMPAPRGSVRRSRSAAGDSRCSSLSDLPLDLGQLD